MRVIACALVLVPLADTLLLCPEADAREARYKFDIPEGPIGHSLTAVAQVTGISVGWPGDLPPFQARRLRGTMDTAEALGRLLEGSGWGAVRTAAGAYRLVRVPAVAARTRPGRARAAPTDTGAPPPQTAEILVTGQKRPQLLENVATSIAIVPVEMSLAHGLSYGSSEVALATEGFALTNLGPGRNRQFIRGVADSPFNGPSQSTVAVQLDNARVTFDAPDPDLRLIDIERVEVLKGPQGPLYGAGALGGIYHLVLRKPDLTAVSATVGAFGQAIQHGGVGTGAEAIVNLPLATDRFAIRAVGYVTRGGGWIDNTGRNRNANSASTDGARLALRWRPDPDWTLDVAGLLQNVNVADSQYVTASHRTLNRDFPIPEPTDNDFRTVSATLQGRAGSLNLLAAVSYVDHAVGYVLDSSSASASFGLKGPSRYTDQRHYSIINGELRVSPRRSTRWIAGLSFMRAESLETGTMTVPTQAVAIEQLDRMVTEISAFGELTIPFSRRLMMTAGVRASETIADNEGAQRAATATRHVVDTIVSPSIAFSWKAGHRSLVFVRYARATRPGGLAPKRQAPLRAFNSDQLGTVELGVRYSPGSALSFSSSAFYTVWNNIQTDYLLPNGLISTRNAGLGIIQGIEASLDWHPRPSIALSAGGTYVDAQLKRTQAGDPLNNVRLPVTPDVTARISASYGFALGRWSNRLTAQANYIGRSHLSFDKLFDRPMGNYATVATAVSSMRGGFTVAARIDNLLDEKGDSFAFGNQFSFARSNQFTPMRPRTFTVSVSRSW